MKKQKSNQSVKRKSKAARHVEIPIEAKGAYIMPYKAKAGSIGYDLAVSEDIHVPAYSRFIIPLNFAIGLPQNVEAKIEPRSGFSLRGIEGYGIRRERKKWLGIFPYWHEVGGKQHFDADILIGKIDPNYKDSVCLIINNHDVAFVIRKGTRLAQMTFYRVVSPKLIEVECLDGEDRGGGIGSTGTTV